MTQFDWDMAFMFAGAGMALLGVTIGYWIVGRYR
jgi:hypothetical protein